MSSFLERFPGYRIYEEIARTELSVVYRAEDERTGTRAAVKLVNNDHHSQREIEMHNRVAQANPSGPGHVMRLLDTYVDGDYRWIALEYFDSTLERIDSSRLTPLALMSIAVDSAKGLVEMYRADVIDDDVKPGNIAFKAESGRAAHLDLGCARLAGEVPVGYTPEYVAPEIRSHKPSNTSPCYGWARSMEYLVIGGGDPGDRHILSDAVPWVGRDFARLVHECRRKNPDRRPPVPALYERMKQIVQRRRRCRCCNAIAFDDGVCVNCRR
jgi:serine/threonine protein kinase